ncbi:MAG: hypothetical protein HKN91_04645 [Acidimicrobiia bacterium]|nr:hypothetical protein [Acidimicrobiia bacterium]
MDQVTAYHPRLDRRAAYALLCVAVLAEILMWTEPAVGLAAHGAVLIGVAVALTAAPETLPESGFVEPGDRPATLAASLIPISVARMTFAVLGTSTWPRAGLLLMVAAVGLASLIAAMRSAGITISDIGLESDFRVVEFLAIAAALPAGIALAGSVPEQLMAYQSASVAVVIVTTVAVTIAAFVDELIYRGMLQTAVAPLGANFGAVLVGAIYALGFAAMWPARWIVLFGLWGLLLALWREASGSIVGPAAAAASFAVGLLAVGPAVLG